MTYLLVAAVGFIIAIVITPAAQQLSQRWQIVARPGGRRQHKQAIPRLGGLPIFSGYIIAIGVVYLIMPPQPDQYVPLRGIIIGTAIVFIGGLLDDWFDLTFYWQLAIQLTAAFIANYHVAFLERIANPTPWTTLPIPGLTIELPSNEIVLATPLAWFITTFWIIGMMNAINWLDGLDGLAAGVGAIACGLFAWHAVQLNQTTIAAFPLALGGTLIAFLFFNFAPARIFLGSAGVYILAYNLATLAFLAPAKTATALMVLALPLLDGIWRIVDRMRQRRSPFSGDRRHLHFLLRDYGIREQSIVIGYYIVTLGLGLVAVIGGFSPPFKLLILIIIGLGILGLLIWFTAVTERKKTE